MDSVTIGRLKELFTGSACTGIENIGNYLQLLLGPRRLIVESAWRILHDGELAVGSASDEPAFEKLHRILVGNTVESAELHGDLNDLRLEFRGGTILETFADSEQYEHWKLIGGPEEMIIAGPGNLWSSF